MLGRIGLLIVGGSIGYAIAQLTSTPSGEVTRQRIRTRAEAVKERTNIAVEKGRLRATELVRSGLDALDAQLEHGQNNIARARETLEKEQVNENVSCSTAQAEQTEESSS